MTSVFAHCILPKICVVDTKFHVLSAVYWDALSVLTQKPPCKRMPYELAVDCWEIHLHCLGESFSVFVLRDCLFDRIRALDWTTYLRRSHMRCLVKMYMIRIKHPSDIQPLKYGIYIIMEGVGLLPWNYICCGVVYPSLLVLLNKQALMCKDLIRNVLLHMPSY